MNIKMNFTGKSKLNDDEFIMFYDQLWEKAPHKCLHNIPSATEIQNIKKEREKIYNKAEPKILENEVWDYFPGDIRYLVSSEGRIKFVFEEGDYQLIQQDDYYRNKPGYLVLKPKNQKARINTTRKSYVFVAITFLGKIEGDGYHVHHIDNNGYDCSTDNLILLTSTQHDAVHLERHLNHDELINFLSDRSQEEEIKKRLALYKLNILGIENCGIYGKYKYPYILPEKEKKQNLIMASYKSQFDDLYVRMESSLHTCFAHLNSSQALCFNLFYPLIFTNHLSLIETSISMAAKASFEHVEDVSFEKVKNPKEKTNFDFFINDEGKKYFFEIKYTEAMFGNVAMVTKNDRHDKKYNDFYKEQINKIVSDDITEEEFFENYQIWRNICHADVGKVFFVFLKSRKSLEKKILATINKCKDIYQKQISILYIEDLVDACLKVQDDKFRKHYLEFSEKYLSYIKD